MINQYQKGDTIIEVLLAVVVFSMLAISSLAIMNQGLSGAQSTLEVTLVRQQIDAQAETLRYINQAYLAGLSDFGVADDHLSAEWQKIQAKALDTDTITPFGANASRCQPIPANAFIMDAQRVTLSNVYPKTIGGTTPDDDTSPPYSQVRYNEFSLDNAYGIWIEAAASPSTAKVRYIDFHIRSCWLGPGAGPAMTLGTIVRLYDTHA